MPDLWEGDVEADAFALPGDEAKSDVLLAEAAQTDPDVAEAIAEQPAEPTDERQRDEQGRFVSQTEEPEAEAETTAAEESARLFANKYQSAEELEKAYLHAQSRLSERDERAALADQYEQYFAQMQQ